MAGTKQALVGMRDSAAERATTGSERQSLGGLLIRAGLLTQEQLEEALDERSVAGGRRERLGETLVRLGFATEAEIAQELAGQLGLEYLELEDLLDGQRAAVDLIPAPLAERHAILPLRLDPDGALLLVCADPTNFVAVEDARLASGARRIRLAIATAAAITAAARSYTDETQRAAGELADAMGDRYRPVPIEAAPAPSDAPVIRLAEGVIAQAVDARASDIHLEPSPSDTVVRFRIDGVLKQAMTVPRSATGPLISRLKLMSGMDISERRRPQDGRSRFRGAGHDVDLRMSSLPSMHGEDIVIRLLRNGVEQLKIGEVGFSAEQLAVALSVIERPQGLVLATGPTGSGKTSTMYAFLAHLASETRKIITVEDPIEYELAGVNQSQTNDRIGFTFARALRTVLRQDPDVVMVGEIRDAETAELAMQASLTGHLVLSTLHTNDAPSAVTRLRDLGVAPYLIASSLSLVVGQRLVRAVCRDCAAPASPSPSVLAQAGLAQRDAQAARFHSGRGCRACSQTGYAGRQGVFEMLTIDATLRELVATQAGEGAVRRAAHAAGMRTLRSDGVEKAMHATTTLEEVLRVTPAGDASAGLTAAADR